MLTTPCRWWTRTGRWWRPFRSVDEPRRRLDHDPSAVEVHLGDDVLHEGDADRPIADSHHQPVLTETDLHADDVADRLAGRSDHFHAHQLVGPELALLEWPPNRRRDEEIPAAQAFGLVAVADLSEGDEGEAIRRLECRHGEGGTVLQVDHRPGRETHIGAVG